MNESTLQGDSVEVTNVDTAAQALLSRYEQTASDEQSTIEAEQTEEKTDVEQAELEAKPEGEEEAQTESSDSESETTDAIDEEAEASFSTIAELAEATGLDIEEFKNSINVTTKVQGEEKQVNLTDLIKGYQLESDYTRKNEAFLTEQKQWEDNRNQAQTELNAEMQKAGYAFKMAQDQLTHEFNAINWGELEKSNPSDFLIQRQKFGERQAQIDQAINVATQNAQNVMNKQEEDKEANNQKYLQSQDELLLKALPDWSEPAIRKEQSEKVAEFLASSGFTPDEISNIRDHRVILMARKAMKGGEMTTDIDLTKKRVKKAPKLVKPNARQNVNQNTQRQAKLMKKVKQTGKVDDVANALLNRWSN